MSFLSTSNTYLDLAQSKRQKPSPELKIDGKSAQALFSHKLIAEYVVGHVEAAILLVNAATDCKWFAPLWKYPICFTDHRIVFVSSTPRQVKQRTNGSAFVYFGQNVQYFSAVLGMFGHVTGGAAW